MTSDADSRASQQSNLPTAEAAVDPTAIEAASTDAELAAAAARVAAEGRQMDFGSYPAGRAGPDDLGLRAQPGAAVAASDRDRP